MNIYKKKNTHILASDYDSKEPNDFAIYGRFPPALVLLDLTVRFGSVEHCVLLPRLRHHVGICASPLSGPIPIKQIIFSSAHLSFGVLQDSILGPSNLASPLFPLPCR